jgi:hypothetical protein
MGLAYPKFVDSTGAATGGSGGSGSGSGSSNPWRDWTEIDIHDSSLWQRRDPATGPSQNATISSSGGVLTYDQPNTGAKQIQPGTIKGTLYIAKAHLKPYEESGIAEPSGVGANEIYPEQFSIKVELLLDDKPITGPVGSESSFGYGQYGQIGVGLVHYGSDQSNAPAMPNASTEWAMARVYKNLTADPEANTQASLYKAGYMTGGNQASTTGATWKCQYSPNRDQDHDAIIFQATFGAASRNSVDRCFVHGGSYATTNPRARFLGSSVGTNGNDATAFTGADDRFVHIAIAFCAFNNTSGSIYQLRAKRLRYLIQPLSHREDFTAE